MVAFVRVLASLLIVAWGLGMILLGIAANVIPWLVTGLLVAGVGLPMLAGSPWVPDWQTMMRRRGAAR